MLQNYSDSCRHPNNCNVSIRQPQNSLLASCNVATFLLVQSSGCILLLMFARKRTGTGAYYLGVGSTDWECAP